MARYEKQSWVNGDSTKPVNAVRLNNLETQFDRALESVAEDIATNGTPIRDALTAGFVRFVDQNGDALPVGSVTTIHVNTTTGEIDDITFEEA